jgi:hypothetical protein
MKPALVEITLRIKVSWKPQYARAVFEVFSI